MPHSVQRSGSVRVRAAVVAGGGLLMAGGSALPWAFDYGGPLFAIAEVSGLTLGPGNLTLLAGLAVIAIGARIVRRESVERMTAHVTWLLGLASLAVLVLTLAGLELGFFHPRPESIVRWSYASGEMLVLAGIALASVAGRQLETRATRSRSSRD
jgi:hypothetical protein